jgi:predicted ribosome quality control (RQC) complex YloA/Tae2 family protein
LRKVLMGRELKSLTSDNASIRLDLSNETGHVSLMLQLRGKPNIFVVDRNSIIIEAARFSDIEGQKVGDVYAAPQIEQEVGDEKIDLIGGTLSAILDAERRQVDSETRFAQLSMEARKKVNSDLAKRHKLLSNLDGDLEQHGNAEQWKKFGDLILASISTLRREGDTIYLTDYFDPDMVEIAIAADRDQSPTEVAEGYFRRYTKARNALTAVSERKNAVNAEIETLERRRAAIEAAIDSRDEERLSDFVTVKRVETQISREKKKADAFTGARKFVSSEGFEILVGKKAKDNDHLTFRIAKSTDTWLHAADYPGSHVIIRNPNRKEIPVPTLLEAAKLAAFYSDEREKPKSAVNYTLKKFVNKPKRAAPGLASLSSFKTILVDAGFPEKVQKA